MKSNDWIVTVECYPEDIPLRGNLTASGNDTIDREEEDKVLEELESGNEWAWCVVAVTVRFRDCLEHTEYLGCCSYASRQDFIDHSIYYEEMVKEGKAEIEKMLQELNR